ncbi:MAG: beta-N-acetylhexosaminidase [Spirochaetota bacterium]
MRIIPAPTDGVCPAPDSLSVAGPEWVEHVIDAVSISPLFPVARYDSSSAALVIVDAPQDVQLVPSELPDSSYSLEVDENAIRIRCSEPAGLVAALRTLPSLRVEGGLSCVQIDDAPKFRYRGMHFDVARHFFDAAFVKRTITLLASLGFNVLHWHLTEDQGWRIPVSRHPRLTEVAAYRTEDDGSTYGGYYSHDEIRDVVRFAGLHGMLVMPEIELPGHARAAIAAYPELSCRQEQIGVWAEWGICEDVFCAGNDAVFDFLEDVFDDVVSLFPSRYVHIGGDECPKTRWKECPKCQARIAGEGLKDEHELQSYFVGRAARALEQRGRIAMGWDEILEGGLPEGTLVMSWRGTQGGIRAAEMGHDVVMTPTSHCYFDYRQVDDDTEIGFPHAQGGSRPPVLTARDVYTFDPLSGIAADAAPHVIGGQANVWTEQLDTPAKVEYMVAPRILAMAEVLWSAPVERDYEEFRDRARTWLTRLDAMNWNYAPLPE